VVAAQHGHQLGGVEAIVLGPTLPAIHLDRGRIANEVVDPFGEQPAMQPKTIAACLVARMHGGIGGQTEPFLGASDFSENGLAIACRRRPHSWRLPKAGRESKLPLVPTEFKGQIKTGRGNLDRIR